MRKLAMSKNDVSQRREVKRKLANNCFICLKDRYVARERKGEEIVENGEID